MLWLCWKFGVPILSSTMSLRIKRKWFRKIILDLAKIAQRVKVPPTTLVGVPSPRPTWQEMGIPLWTLSSGLLMHTMTCAHLHLMRQTLILVCLIECICTFPFCFLFWFCLFQEKGAYNPGCPAYLCRPSSLQTQKLACLCLNCWD